MKNTSFKRLWTKTSLKRILKEFSEKPIHMSAGFICFGSLEFSALWNNFSYRSEIKKLVKDFLGEEKGKTNDHNISISGANVLFTEKNHF